MNETILWAVVTIGTLIVLPPLGGLLLVAWLLRTFFQHLKDYLNNKQPNAEADAGTDGGKSERRL